MSKIQLYKYAALGLLVLNLALIGFFMLTKRGGPPGGPNHVKPHKVLKLTQEQEKTFHEFVREHQETMSSIDKQQAKLLADYFKTAAEDNQVPLPPEIEALNRSKIEATYQHLKQIKAMLNEEQLPHFDEFVTQLLRHLERRHPNRKPRPRK